MRYGLSAAIITGVFCGAPGEPARTTGDRNDDHLPNSYEMTPLPGLHFEDDIHFFDDRTSGGVRPRPDGRRIAHSLAKTLGIAGFSR
jgi:hypothetical protein